MSRFYMAGNICAGSGWGGFAWENPLSGLWRPGHFVCVPNLRSPWGQSLAEWRVLANTHKVLFPYPAPKWENREVLGASEGLSGERNLQPSLPA